MKWNKWDPAAFLEGVIGLSAEERGFYITLISLQYARSPHGHVTDELVIKAMACRPQIWRRVKLALMAKGKVHETDGKLTANRVETEVKLAVNRIGKMTDLANKRWKNKGIGNAQPHMITTTTTTSSKETKEDPLSLPRKSRAKPKTTLPDNWHPELEGGIEYDRFCDHARANGRLCADWEAAWRNWNRNAPRFNNNGGQNGGITRPGYKDKRQQELEDVKAALDASIARANNTGEGGTDDQTPDGVLPFHQRA